MHWKRAAVFTVFLAFGWPYLPRLYPVWLLIVNNPLLLREINTFSDYKIKFENTVRNCEDVVLDEQRGVAILSCDAGRDKWNTVMGVFINPIWSGGLWYYKYPKYEWDDEPAIHHMQVDGMNVQQWMKFHPLGLAYWPTTRKLYVVNHGPVGPTIEVFKVNKDITGVDLETSISHPALNTPNSVTPISDHEIYVTNDHRYEIRHEKMKAKMETYLGIPGGSVVYHNLKTNTTFKVADLPFANGIVFFNATLLAVASTTTPSINIYSISPTMKGIALQQTIRVPFWVDNLSVDSDRKLLMAGHPWAPALEHVATNNVKYAITEWHDPDEVGLPMEQRPRAPSWVAEWDGVTLKHLYVGKAYGTSSAVVRDVKRGFGIVVGLYERGVMLFKT